MINRLRLYIKENDLSVYAASIAYFLFLSFIPMMVIICSLLPFTPLNSIDLLEFLKEITPESMNDFLEDLVSQIYKGSLKTVSLALLIAFWSAGKGMMALIRAFNKIYQQEEERSYLRLRIVASGYTVVTLLIILLLMCMGLLGEIFFYYPFVRKMGGSLFLWKMIRESVLTGIFFLFVLSIYSFIPIGRRKIKTQIPGAAFVTFIWGVFSYGFSVYTDYFSGFTAYGTVGIVILLLLWIYSVAYILLIGIFFDKK